MSTTAAATCSTLGKSEMNKVRGAKITMIFQEPMTSLDPLYSIGSQLMEPIRTHRGLARRGGADGSGAAARAGAYPAPRTAAEGLSARVVRRAAPARDDRHGARQRPRHPDRRRADHRARRDDPGADSGTARRAAGAARHGDRLHHPRPRHRAALRRPRLCHAVGCRRRGRRYRGDLHGRQASLYAHAARRRTDRPQGAAAGRGAHPARRPQCRGRLPHRRRLVRRPAGRDPRRRPHLGHAAQGPDDRHRRRVRLGQVDARPGAAQAAAERGRGSGSRTSTSRGPTARR